MADIERLSIALPSPMADAVCKAISEGKYASASEVVRDALRLWQQRRHLHERERTCFADAWDEGKASGRAVPLDVERILAEERAAFKGVGWRRD